MKKAIIVFCVLGLIVTSCNSGRATSESANGGSGDETPLFEQPLDQAYECTVVRQPALDPEFGSLSIALGPAVEGGNMVAVANKSGCETPFTFGGETYPPGVYAGHLGLDGALTGLVSVWECVPAEDTSEQIDTSERIGSIVVVEQGSNRTLLWVATSSWDEPYSYETRALSSLCSAQVDVDNQLVTQPTCGFGVGGTIFTATSGTETRAFVNSHAFALNYGDVVEGSYSIHSAPLSQSGATSDEPWALATPYKSTILRSVVAFSDGYAMSYVTEGGTDYYVAVDAELVPRHKRIVDLGGTLLAQKDSVVLAQVVSTVDVISDDSTLNSIRLSRVDGEGNVLSTALLQTPSAEVSSHAPILLAFGGDIGLLWGSGSGIALSFVILDGVTLRPKSNVIELESPSRVGLSGAQLDWSGADFLLVAADGGSAYLPSSTVSAHFTCTPTP